MDDDDDDDEALNSRGLARATTTGIIIVSLSSKVPSFKLRWGSIIIIYNHGPGTAGVVLGSLLVPPAYTHTHCWIGFEMDRDVNDLVLALNSLETWPTLLIEIAPYSAKPL